GDRAHGRGSQGAHDQASRHAPGADAGAVQVAVDEVTQGFAGRTPLVAAAGHEGELGRIGQADLERLALLQAGLFGHATSQGASRAWQTSAVRSSATAKSCPD